LTQSLCANLRSNRPLRKSKCTTQPLVVPQRSVDSDGAVRHRTPLT